MQKQKDPDPYYQEMLDARARYDRIAAEYPVHSKKRKKAYSDLGDARFRYQLTAMHGLDRPIV